MAKTLKIVAQDASATALSRLLRDNGVNAVAAERKGGAEISMILVAVGGGAGLGAVLAGLGNAFKAYFEGLAEIEKHSSLEISYGDTTIVVKGRNVEAALEQIKSLLK